MKKLEIADFANDAYYEKQEYLQAKKMQNKEFLQGLLFIAAMFVIIFIVGIVEGSLTV